MISATSARLHVDLTRVLHACALCCMRDVSGPVSQVRHRTSLQTLATCNTSEVRSLHFQCSAVQCSAVQRSAVQLHLSQGLVSCHEHELISRLAGNHWYAPTLSLLVSAPHTCQSCSICVAATSSQLASMNFVYRCSMLAWPKLLLCLEGEPLRP